VNGYFKQSDPSIKELAGYPLPSDWWSRPWEYAWAIEHAVSYMTAADMGCGWMYRPFKDALAEVCKYVYAVDADQRLHKQDKADNMGFVTLTRGYTNRIKPTTWALLLVTLPNRYPLSPADS
jgi:hypothetical protein